MKIYPDIVYKDGLMLDIYAPDAENFPVIVWFHGGGLESGSRKGMERLAENAAKYGYGFVMVEYRMYPSARYPDYLLDAANAIAFVQLHIREYGGSGKMVISGSSAGAYMTMMLYVNPAFLRNVYVDASDILAFVSDSAQVTTHFNVLRERGIDTRAERIDEAAPLYYTDKLVAPKPLLLLWYKEDMPCRPEQNRLMLQSLCRCCPDAVIQGVELAGGHCAGIDKMDTDGEYPYIKETVRFVQNLK